MTDLGPTGNPGPTDDLADLDTYRIDGWIPDHGHIAIPLHSLIVPKVGGTGALWMGGTPATYLDSPVPEGVVAILDLFGQSYQPKGILRSNYRCDPMDDWGARRVDTAKMERLSVWIAQHRGKGEDVLVHCQAGINRSSLVTAFHLYSYDHMPPDEAIDLIREQRSPICFANALFEGFIRDLPPLVDGA